MSLRDVHSQDHIIEAFQQSIQLGRLGQSYIFAGPDGVGRFKLASELSKALLCENPQRNIDANGEFIDSCGACNNCKLFEAGNHPDFKHIYKELNAFSQDAEVRKKTPSEFPISVIREFFIDIIAGRPQIADKVIYVVSEAEKLNKSAQNAILKTLEEPPKHCIIILLCTKTNILLDTILSRCQVVRFGPVSREKIAAKLAENGIGQEAATFWAGFTYGSIGESALLSSLDAGLYKIKHEFIARLAKMRLADSIDMAQWALDSAAAIADSLSATDENSGKADLKRRAQKIMLRVMLVALLDTMKVGAGCKEIINVDQLNEIQEIASHIDPYQASKLLEKINGNITWIDRYVNDKLIFEDILINFAQTQR